MPKVYTTGLNMQITMEVKFGGWKASSQARFRKRHCRGDLNMVVNSLLNRAVDHKQPKHFVELISRKHSAQFLEIDLG